MSGPVLIMAGGTGGHVYPGLAVAARLQAHGTPVVWLGTRTGLEARLVVQAGIPIEHIEVSGLRGRGVVGWLLAPLTLLRAVWQAVRIIRRVRPAAVLGMGGFASGPGGVAAWLLRRPLLIHEQNAVAGLTNRWLARLADRVYQAFPQTLPGGETVGNPVREAITALPPPGERLVGSGPLRLLVVGGSLGAVALNEAVPAALAQLPAEQRPHVVHQAGRGKQAACAERYRTLGVEAQVVEFIETMPAAYAEADLVVCRAGALTVSELAAAGLAAVLVPYPHAVDDHQRHNARWLVEAGGAELLLQTELADGLVGVLQRLLTGGREGLRAMAERARAVAVTDAAEQVANGCLAAGRVA